MSLYRLSHEAVEDLADIWLFIANDDPLAADQWNVTLFESFQMLAEHPRAGRIRTDIPFPDLRFWSVGRYIVIYRTLSAGVEIVAVTQGARDVPLFLGQRMRSR